MNRFTSCIVAMAIMFMSLLTITVFSCSTTQSNTKGFAVPDIPLDQNSKGISNKILRAYQSSVSILYLDTGLTKVAGSGVILKNKKNKPIHILTAYHVIQAIQEKQGKDAVIIAGHKNPSEIILTNLHSYNKKDDLALLIGIIPQKQDGPYVVLAKERPVIGSNVWVIGSPTGIERNVTRCVLSTIIYSKGVRMYRTCAEVYFGNSGGGMFNDNQELIGIMVQIALSSNWPGPVVVPGSGMAVSLPHIKKFLETSLP